MKKQNYANHARYVPLFHFVTFGLVLLTDIGAVVRLVRAFFYGGSFEALQILGIAVILTFLFFFSRLFALRAQDRAIRAEENFRHYLLTGKPHDSRLNISQIIGLRFAPDDEFAALAQKAVAENMNITDIKRAIKQWRPDDNRA